MQADRRRNNPPAGGTAPPLLIVPNYVKLQRPKRARPPEEHRNVFLRTRVVPSASGSAYFELPPQSAHKQDGLLIAHSSSLKITCTVHGPRPLPRNAAFSPNLLLAAHVKFAPFATRNRRGYVRDASERDLGLHLESALRGVIIGGRWPKAGCDVVITVLEAEDDGWWAAPDHGGGWGMMNVLAGCITVASAALVDAGIDCVDLVSGGVAALVQEDGEGDMQSKKSSGRLVLDPAPAEHAAISAACVVAYLHSRDEITEIWMKGEVGEHAEALVDGAIKAAALVRTVLVEAVEELMEVKTKDGEAGKTRGSNNGKSQTKDVTMTD